MPGNFIVSTEDTLSGTTETNILYILNLSTNTVNLSNIRLTGTSLDAGVGTTFRVYVDPTVTNNGTSLSITSLDFADGMVSSMKAYLTPTVSSKGTKVNTFSVISSGSYLVDTLNWFLLHGHSLLITAQVNTASKGIAVNISWSE
jgi:hypothetical protein